MMHVTEPKYYKCYHCKRQYTKNEYLGYWCCDYCERRVRDQLEAHLNRYVDSKIYDTLPTSQRRIVLVRDKCELFIVRDYIRSIIAQMNSDPDEYGHLTEQEVKDLLKECDIGMYHHSLLMHYQNEEWQQIILNYRIRSLGVKYERG